MVVIHGWAYWTHSMAALIARVRGHEVCIRGESPLNQELMRSPRELQRRRVLLGLWFRAYHKFLFIGSQNNWFYEYYGVPADRRLFVPYAVDNNRFKSSADELIPHRNALKSLLGLSQASQVILFAAKFIPKKRPQDLLEAFHLLGQEDVHLIMVGSGELLPEMESLVNQRGIKNVIFPGFANQGEIGRYYAIADVFVLCSGVGETWGLAVNEAMNFGVSVVVSDCCGCAVDLVIDGKTGFVFKTGDVLDLTRALKEGLQLQPMENAKVLERYSFKTITKTLQTLI